MKKKGERKRGQPAVLYGDSAKLPWLLAIARNVNQILSPNIGGNEKSMV